MKKIFLTLFSGLLFTHAAMGAEIVELHCLASNGVLLKGVSKSGKAMQVDTQWGVFHKDFTAAISKESSGDTVVIDLLTKENGTEYQLLLDVRPLKNRVQRTTGSILQLSAVRGIQPALVAYVSCDLQLR